jgi:DNA repair protein RadC
MNSVLSIKDWNQDDQPREKLVMKGRTALSDAELLAILIGTGTKNLSALELSKKLLKDAASNRLDNLSRLTVKELTKFKGIGQAKAVTIVAAMELARRRKETAQDEKAVIKSSKQAYDCLNPYLSDLLHEEFYILLLNRANQVISVQHIGKGGITGTVADIRLMLKSALEHLATGIILAHNHPSGQLRPSEADIQLTKNVKEGSKVLQIDLLDHLIIGNNAYFSFADEGIL